MDAEYTCLKANKYGCLNTNAYSCGWLESNKCQLITLNSDNFVSCSNFLGSDEDLPVYTGFNAKTCSQLEIYIDDTYRSCLRDATY